MDLFKEFKVFTPFHPNQIEDLLLNLDFIKKGIILPRPFILEFQGTIKELKEKLLKHKGFAIERILIKNELEKSEFKLKTLQQVEELEKEIQNQEIIFNFIILIQIYGQICLSKL